MEERYLPEGRHTARPLTEAVLTAALADGDILQGRVLRCTEAHDLIIDCAGTQAYIPRCDAAIGIESGRTREIAVLSRVGKPVCFKVAGQEDGVFRLSRRAAQQETLRYYLERVPVGQVVPCRVTHIENFGVFVDIGCGLCSMIGIENISVSRISHPAERFYTRQDIFAAVAGKDEKEGRIYLTHRELLGTWEQNCAGLKTGETVGGIVRGVEDYGVFVELTPNLSGLAERKEGVMPGACVSVFIKSILPERMKIKLIIIDSLECPARGFLSRQDYFITSGSIDGFCYRPQAYFAKKPEKTP